MGWDLGDRGCVKTGAKLAGFQDDGGSGGFWISCVTRPWIWISVTLRASERSETLPDDNAPCECVGGPRVPFVCCAGAVSSAMRPAPARELRIP